MRNVNRNKYPYNLAYDIIEKNIDLPADIHGSIDYIITRLPEHEQMLLRMRYKDARSYCEISDAMGGKTVNSIQNNIDRILKKLRTSKYKQFVTKGVAKMLKAEKESTRRKIRELKNTISTLLKASAEPKRLVTDKTINNMAPIEHLDLSPRTHNALRRAGIDFIGDILVLDSKTLSSIKGLGRSCCDEIITKLTMHNYPTDGFYSMIKHLHPDTSI